MTNRHSEPEGPNHDVLHALQERAKELSCLYRVDEILSQPGKPLDEASAAAAASASTLGAAPLSDNGYKVGLVRTLVRRTLLSLAERGMA